MSDETDSTEEESKTQVPPLPLEDALGPPKIQVVGAQEHTYDAKQIAEFIAGTFENVPAGAHRLMYTRNLGQKGFSARTVAEMEKLITRTTVPRGLYFLTSSAYPDANGKLSHGKAQFAALHVVVLDDIGSLIKHSDLPELLQTPSYKIESSQGNYQYGYFLDKPIGSYNNAATLINTIMAAGYTDPGGAMPCKIVRLPDGVNGKDDEIKRDFHVKLAEPMSMLVFTPEQLIDAVHYQIDGVAVTWDAIKQGRVSPIGSKYRAHYLPDIPQAQSSNGIIDEPLEILLSLGHPVEDDGQGWIGVECINALNHTSGENLAGYMPFGRGDGSPTRGYKCFHGHCSELDTYAFLAWCINSSKGKYEYISYRQEQHFNPADYAYYPHQHAVFDLTGSADPVPWAGFTNTYPFNRRLTVINGAGKAQQMKLGNYWLQSPQCINVESVVHDPRKDRLFTNDSGGKVLNTFRPQHWSLDAYDEGKISPFLDFVEYLFPEQDEREYILDMLTSKLNDLTFRGTAIVMMTQTHGVGRTTFMKIIGELMGVHNVSDMTIAEMFEGNFNDWLQSLLLCISETKTTAKDYERFKQIVDTTGREIRINAKHIGQKQIYCCPMTFMATNSPDGVSFTDQDRRFTVVSNPERAANDTYFDQLNDWLVNVDWAPHVACYLKQRTLTGVNLYQPLITGAREAMQKGAASELTRALIALRDYLTDNKIGYITSTSMVAIVTEAMQQTGQDQPQTTHLRKALNDISTPLKYIAWVKETNKSQRCRLILQGRNGPSEWATHYQMGDARRKAPELGQAFKNEINIQINMLDPAAAVATVVDEIR